jgi:ADP-heptose:LPS heptosyltransferase
MKILLSLVAKKLKSGKPNPKDYPYWKELIELLKNDGHELVQVGITGEQQMVDNFQQNLDMQVTARLIQDCDMFISVDTFLQHYAWSLGKYGIVLWGQGNPEIFGHKENCNLLKDKKYIRKNIFEFWDNAECIDEAFVEPKVVMDYLENFVWTENTKRSC